MAWLSGYSKRKPLVLTGGASGAQTDFQLKLAVAYAAAMQGDFDDLRFTQANGTTLIDAWLESKVDDTSAVPWAEFPTTPANTVEQTYYMYYGNAGAASYWDIGATFVFGDDTETGNTQSGAPMWSTTNNLAATDQKHGGTYSAKGDNVAAADFQTKALSLPVDGSRVLRFWWRCDSLAGRHKQPMTTDDIFDNSWDDVAIQLDLGRTSGTVIYYDGAYKDSGLTYEEDTWICFELLHHATSFDIRKSDGSWVTGLGYRNNPSQFNRFLHQSSNYSGIEDVWIDDVCVRKYVANPPTYAFGSEESAPTGHPTTRRWGGIPGMQYTGRRSW